MRFLTSTFSPDKCQYRTYIEFTSAYFSTIIHAIPRRAFILFKAIKLTLLQQGDQKPKRKVK